MSSVEAKITASGQMSLPAPMRRRWEADRVLVIDLGYYAIVRPIPQDVPKALRGRFSGPGPTSDEMRSDGRREEIESEARSR